MFVFGHLLRLINAAEEQGVHSQRRQSLKGTTTAGISRAMMHSWRARNTCCGDVIRQQVARIIFMNNCAQHAIILQTILARIGSAR